MRRRSYKIHGVTGLIIALIAAAVYLLRGTPHVPPGGLITQVVDGDTLHVESGGTVHKVRLIGVDTPEVHPSFKLDRDAERTHQDKKTIVALGKRASAFTRGLCKGKSCRLEYDQANAARGHRDDFGRLLAYVWVAGEDGREVLLNAEIIRQGFGNAMTRYAFDAARQEEFLRLQREARAQGRGLWGEK